MKKFILIKVALFGLLLLLTASVAHYSNRSLKFNSKIWKQARIESDLLTCQRMLNGTTGIPKKYLKSYEDVVYYLGFPDISISDNDILVYRLGKGRMSLQLFKDDLKYILYQQNNGSYEGRIIPD